VSLSILKAAQPKKAQRAITNKGTKKVTSRGFQGLQDYQSIVLQRRFGRCREAADLQSCREEQDSSGLSSL